MDQAAFLTLIHSAAMVSFFSWEVSAGLEGEEWGLRTVSLETDVWGEGVGSEGIGGLEACSKSGFCFQHLRVVICPKANSCLWQSRAWAPVPSGSSKEKVRELVVPGLYMEEAWTHKGFWVMIRDA